MEPKAVFEIFSQINKVPRPSKHEEQISKWLCDFAATHNIECVADEAMNVIMRVPATPGYESHDGVILQAHMDMVCEKNGDVQHDFMTDPIQTWVDGEWLKAKGTTLGADDGIGIAMALAAITDKNLPHPAIECLFTVDEETGLTGAMKLKDGMLKSKRLINLDSEDDGQIFIGCAGGIDTLAKMHYEPISVSEAVCQRKRSYNVNGLTGEAGLLAVQLRVRDFSAVTQGMISTKVVRTPTSSSSGSSRGFGRRLNCTLLPSTEETSATPSLAKRKPSSRSPWLTKSRFVLSGIISWRRWKVSSAKWKKTCTSTSRLAICLIPSSRTIKPTNSSWPFANARMA